MDKLYNAVQAAKFLGIARSAFYSMRNDGLVPEPLIKPSPRVLLWSEEQLKSSLANVRRQGYPKNVPRKK